MAKPEFSAAPVRPLWLLPGLRWLFSIRVGIVLLAVLAVVSIGGSLIGPIIQDGIEIESAVSRAQRLVFYSGWYKILLVLLAVNIGCATIQNIIVKILPASRPQFLRDPAIYQNDPGRIDVACGRDMDQIGQQFARRGFRFHKDGPWGYAVRGLAGRWGAPVAHLGFVVVLAGAFLASLLAREGWIQLAEGETTAAYHTQSNPAGSVALGFALRCEDFDTAFFPHTSIPSHFVTTLTVWMNGKEPVTGPVEVNRSLKAGGWTFHQASYDLLDGERRYRLAVARASQPVETIELSQGQSRPIPGQERLTIGLSPQLPLRWAIAQVDGGMQTKPLRSGPLVERTLPLRVEALRFEPDFVVLGKGQYGSRSADLHNPAVQVSLFEDQQRVLTQWLFGAPEMKAMMPGGNDTYDLELIGIQGTGEDRRFTIMICDKATQVPLGAVDLRLGENQVLPPEVSPDEAQEPAAEWQVSVAETVPMYATTLTLTRNPVLPLIYAGCAIMLAGLVLAFFVRTSQAYLWLDENRQRLFLVGRARHGDEPISKAIRSALGALE